MGACESEILRFKHILSSVAKTCPSVNAGTDSGVGVAKRGLDTRLEDYHTLDVPARDKVRSRQWKCSVMSSEPAHRCIFTEHTHVGDWVMDAMYPSNDHRIPIGGTTLGARRPTDVKAHVPLGKRWQDGGSRRAARVLLGRHS